MKIRVLESVRAWIRREVRTALADEARAHIDSVVVRYDNPMQTFTDQAPQIDAQLRQAANVVGSRVMVGRDVILWGGNFPGGVGLELHDGVRLYEGCRLVIDHMSPASGIVLEEHVQMSFGVYIDGTGGVRIRRRTVVGPYVVMLSSSHRIDAERPVSTSGKDFGGVDIGEDVWIGANAVIRMGITIGDRAVVGAGSIVTRNVPAGAIVAGNPARVLRQTDERASPLQA